jgi:hypothetical protein
VHKRLLASSARARPDDFINALSKRIVNPVPAVDSCINSRFVRVTGNLSFRACGPRNFMRAVRSNNRQPQHQALCFQGACDSTVVLSTLGTSLHTFPISAVVSMGGLNTQVESDLH